MASKYLIGGGNWSADTIWSTTDGGANDTTHPVAGDAVFLTQTSGAVTLTVDVASACTSLHCTTGTGFPGTLAMGTQTLTVSGSVTLASTMTITGTTGELIVDTTGTLTSNTKTWPVALRFKGTSQTYTIADTWNVTGLLTLNSTTAATLNTGTINVSGGYKNQTGTTSGTSTIVMKGGSWTGPGGNVSINLKFDGNVTVGTGVNAPAFSNATLTHLSGTITTTGSELYVSGTPTFDTNGMTWDIFRLLGSPTVTLNSTLSANTLKFHDATATFLGTAGFTVGTLTSDSITVSRTITLHYGNTYAVTSAMTIAGAGGFKWTFISSDGTNHVVFNFSGASSPSLTGVNATRINSNGGLTIYTDGTITTCDNWQAASGPSTTPNTMRNVYRQAINRASNNG